MHARTSLKKIVIINMKKEYLTPTTEIVELDALETILAGTTPVYNINDPANPVPSDPFDE